MIKCNINPLVIPKNVTKPLDEKNYVASNEYYTIDSTWSGYSLKMENEYAVYGVLIYKNQIRYLIFDDNGIPGFYPSCLFDVVEGYLLFDWSINIFDIYKEKCVLLISENVVGNYDDFRDLIDNTDGAIKRLLKYRDSLL